MILHTLSASPASSAYHDCLRLVQSIDAVVLMGDGVYAALGGTQACSELLATGVEVYLLKADALAAGVTAVGQAVTCIDMDEFVTLTERFPRQLAWY